jgi:phosphate transport system permease protein
MSSITAEAAITRWTGDAMQARLRKRYRSERLFKLLGFAAVGISLAFLAFLLGTMLWKGAGGLSLGFLTMSDSTDPATAGVWGALKGSFLTIVVTMALAFPVGVLSAIYLEEFATRIRWTDMIEVSINNLAAVPSIIFGLLGLAVFLNFMHLPRSAPLVGGLTLALMTMPVIVIAGRNAIQAVPPSIRASAGTNFPSIPATSKPLSVASRAVRPSA